MARPIEDRSSRQAFAVDVAALEKARDRLQKRKIPWIYILVFPIMLLVNLLTRRGQVVPESLYWSYGGVSIVILLLVVAYKVFYEVRFHRALHDGMARMVERAETAAADGTPEPVAEEYARYVKGLAFREMNNAMGKRFRFDLTTEDGPK